MLNDCLQTDEPSYENSCSETQLCCFKLKLCELKTRTDNSSELKNQIIREKDRANNFRRGAERDWEQEITNNERWWNIIWKKEDKGIHKWNLCVLQDMIFDLTLFTNVIYSTFLTILMSLWAQEMFTNALKRSNYLFTSSLTETLNGKTYYN